MSNTSGSRRAKTVKDRPKQIVVGFKDQFIWRVNPDGSPLEPGCPGIKVAAKSQRCPSCGRAAYVGLRYVECPWVLCHNYMGLPRAPAALRRKISALRERWERSSDAQLRASLERQAISLVNGDKPEDDPW